MDASAQVRNAAALCRRPPAGRQEGRKCREQGKVTSGRKLLSAWTPYKSPVRVVTSRFLATIDSARADDKREKGSSVARIGIQHRAKLVWIHGGAPRPRAHRDAENAEGAARAPPKTEGSGCPWAEWRPRGTPTRERHTLAPAGKLQLPAGSALAARPRPSRAPAPHARAPRPRASGRDGAEGGGGGRKGYQRRAGSCEAREALLAPRLRPERWRARSFSRPAEPTSVSSRRRERGADTEKVSAAAAAALFSRPVGCGGGGPSPTRPHAAALAGAGRGSRTGLGGGCLGWAGNWRSAMREARAVDAEAVGGAGAAARWGQVPAWAQRPTWTALAEDHRVRPRGHRLFLVRRRAPDAGAAAVKRGISGESFSFHLSALYGSLRGESMVLGERKPPHPSFLTLFTFCKLLPCSELFYPGAGRGGRGFLKMKHWVVQPFLWAIKITPYHSVACWIFCLQSSQSEAEALPSAGTGVNQVTDVFETCRLFRTHIEGWDVTVSSTTPNPTGNKTISVIFD